MTPPPIRPAVPDDVEWVVSTVAVAFADDPAWSFMLGPGDLPARLAFARALLLPRIRGGTAWVTDDCSAVAMWDRLAENHAEDDVDGRKDDVDGSKDDPNDPWPAFRSEVGDDAWARIEIYESALSTVEPARPFWYLGVLATHPDVQGRGLAGAVMQPGFDAASADGWGCWLETSTEGNKSFYSRRGFTQSRAVDIPGGPPTWWLGRPHG